MAQPADVFQVLRPGLGAEDLDAVVETKEIGVGASAIPIERLTFGDGRTLVRKTISPARDWMMRVTRDSGRAALLPLEGWMQHLPAGVEDGVVAVARSGPDWVLYLEDVSDAFGRTRRETFREIGDEAMRRMGAMHRAYLGLDVPHLATPRDLLRLASPATLENLGSVGSTPFIAQAQRGWELFAEIAPPDVAEVVFAVDDDEAIAPLVRALESGPQTLLHADLHFGNMVFDADRLVILDWSLAARGPGAFDFVWFLDRLSDNGDLDGEEWVSRFLQRDDPSGDVATLDACCLAELILSGWGHGHRVTEQSDRQPWFRQWFDWWTARARRGIEAVF